MPLSEVIAGAALGLALQILHETIQKGKDRSSTTRCILDRLDATIFRITPLIAKVEKLSEEADEPLRKVIEDLKHLLENAAVLVEAYVELKRRKLLKKTRYKRRIKELEASLRWMVDVDVQVNQWSDIKEIMAKMSDMNTKLDAITCRPIDCITSDEDNNIQNIVDRVDRSLEANDGCSNDDSNPKITCRPIDCIRSVEDNQNQIIIERVDRSLELSNDGCLNDDSNPKIDIHLRWTKQSKNHGMRFVLH